MNTKEILELATKLVGGERQRTHGDKHQNHWNIAQLWNAYLSIRIRSQGQQLCPRDIAILMVLLKVSRTVLGDHNPDNYVDMAGYAGIAGEIAGDQHAVASRDDRSSEQGVGSTQPAGGYDPEAQLEDIHNRRGSW